jgi:hypothetical protein
MDDSLTEVLGKYNDVEDILATLSERKMKIWFNAKVFQGAEITSTNHVQK